MSTAKMNAEREKSDPFATLDGRKGSVLSGEGTITVESLKDADEALNFLENHPRAVEIAEEGNAILEDPVQLKKLVRKIDLTIAPLLAAVYFLQFLDKTTLSYTAVMGIREDTHLKGQDYSDLSMLFYIGMQASRLRDSIQERMLIIRCRLPCSRISHSIPRAAHLKIRSVSGYQYHDLGSNLGLPWCMHNFRWALNRSNFAWHLRELVGISSLLRKPRQAC